MQTKFLYKEPKVKHFIYAILFSGSLTIFSYFSAYDKKEIIYKGIHISRDISIILNWGFFALFSTITIAAIYLLTKQITKEKIQRHIVLHDTYLSACKGIFSNKIINIRYSDIISLNINKIKNIKNLKTLQIKHKGGCLNITNSYVSDNDLIQIYATVSILAKTNLSGNN